MANLDSTSSPDYPEISFEPGHGVCLVGWNFPESLVPDIVQDSIWKELLTEISQTIDAELHERTFAYLVEDSYLDDAAGEVEDRVQNPRVAVSLPLGNNDEAEDPILYIDLNRIISEIEEHPGMRRAWAAYFRRMADSIDPDKEPPHE